MSYFNFTWKSQREFKGNSKDFNVNIHSPKYMPINRLSKQVYTATISSLPKNCSNTESFLVRIFLYFNWIWTRTWRYNTKQEQQLIDLYWNICASASRWFYYKTALWNFKYCRVQIEKVSYWLSSKQVMSNYVSLCQDMRFLLAFPQQLIKLRYSIEFGLRA